MSADTTPDPSAGGRYVRNGDGSLKQIHKTEAATDGLRSDPSDPVAPAAGQAPAPTSNAAAPAAGKKE